MPSRAVALEITSAETTESEPGNIAPSGTGPGAAEQQTGEEIGLQFDAKEAAGTPSIENVLIPDGQIEKISEMLE